MNDQFNMPMRVTEGFRSFDRQAQLYAIGRETPGSIVTNAQPGFSAHNYAIAADCCFRGLDPYLSQDDEAERLWENYGQICEGHGLSWGGHFTGLADYPHCELRYGNLSLAEMKTIYDVGGLAGVFNKFDSILAGKVQSG